MPDSDQTSAQHPPAPDLTAGPVSGRAAWEALAASALRGRPITVLDGHTEDGLAVHPLYTADDNKTLPDLPRPRRGAGARDGAAWRIRQRYRQEDPSRANRAILDDLNGGVSALTLTLADYATGASGITVAGLDDLRQVLAGVRMDIAPVTLEAGTYALPAAALMLAHWRRENPDPEKLAASLGLDPLGVLSATGRLTASVEDELARMADMAAWVARHWPGVNAVQVSTARLHAAGATNAQELAGALATGVAYLRALTGAGLTVDEACRQIGFMLVADADFFQTVIKLRAIQKLWWRITEACGATAPARVMRLEAETAWRMLTRQDPWTNVLRVTMAAFAAGVAGVSGVTATPFVTAPDNIPDTSDDSFMRRMSRNIQLVLQEEAFLGRVEDPAGGAWYVENATDTLARASWERFQEIEANGGMAVALTDGLIASWLNRARDERQRRIATAEQPLVGVNVFSDRKNSAGKDTSRESHHHPGLVAKSRQKHTAFSFEAPGHGFTESLIEAAEDGAGLNDMIQALTKEPAILSPLPCHRLSEPFEDLQDRGERWRQANKQELKVFLAALGAPREYQARAGFAAGLFATAGIGLTEPVSFTTVAEVVEAFRASGLRSVVLCSSGNTCKQMAADTASALKQAGARYILLAGQAGDTYAGIDAVLYPGCPMPGILHHLYDRLEKETA